MRQYLTEGATGAFPFVVDRSKPFVTESRPDGGAYTRIPGRFSICDCVNGNGRRYSKRVWEKNLQNGSPLMDAISRNAAFGLLEHPKDGVVTLLSPISHQVTAAKMVEGKGPEGKMVHEVIGEISLYGTPEGQKLKALIEGGYNPLVSSRGYGTLEKSSDGVDEVQEDYVCEGWDVVIKPSFEQAELKPMREPIAPGTDARMAAPVGSSESLPAKGAEKALSESSPVIPSSVSPPKPPAAPAAPVSESKTPKTMEINEIRSRISTLRAVDPSKVAPQQFAESLADVEHLHNEVARYAAADPTRSYEATRAHRELDQITEQFTQAAQLPRQQARKLNEANLKLMKVINATAATALTYKKKLGEALTTSGKTTKVVEELTRRGQGWHKLAESRGQKLAKTGKQFDTACEALDIMAARYHADTTELGRRLLQLEFREALAGKPALQKKLKEANRLRHIAAIREELEGKKPGTTVAEDETGVGKPTDGETPSKKGIKDDKQKGAPSPEEGKVASEPGKVTNESKSAEPRKATLTEAAKVRFTTSGDPRGVNESVEMVRRMSVAPAK